MTTQGGNSGSTSELRESKQIETKQMKNEITSPEGLAGLRFKFRRNYVVTREPDRNGTRVNLIVRGMTVPECRSLGMERTPWV
jgi:hypothetical protein